MDDTAILAELRGMRQELLGSHTALGVEVRTGIEKLSTNAAAHEKHDVERFAAINTRLLPIESTGRNVKWLLAAVVVAGLSGAADAWFNHLTKVIK